MIAAAPGWRRSPRVGVGSPARPCLWHDARCISRGDLSDRADTKRTGETMASAKPGDDPISPPVGDPDRGNNPAEPADPQVLATGLGEAVHESHGFPSGGGDGGRVGPIREGGPGSTVRGAADSGHDDAGGTPGGGSAGSSGG